jgi:hypothetical protein
VSTLLPVRRVLSSWFKLAFAKCGDSRFQSENPLDSSHLFISSAIWSLFLSIIIMCELPLMPTSGKSTKSQGEPS